MPKLPRAVRGCIVLAFIAGCSTGDVVLREPAPGYVPNPRAHVAAADWSKVETVTIALSEYAFTPATQVFRRGKPYRLRLRNTGGRTHNFTSQGFFKAIAVQRLRTPQGEIAGPYLKAVEVPPGAVKDLYFVAVRPGRFDLECSVLFHASLGMEGKIEVR